MIYPDARVKEPFEPATTILWSAGGDQRTASVLDQIGNTPLIDLSAFAHRNGVGKGVKVLAKAEWFNPGGSVKARAALQIVREGEQSGDLAPGKTIIDSSSGNTGIALALIGAVKGYPVELVMPGNVSAERKALVRAYGAKLIETDPLGGSDGAILRVRERVAIEPGSLFLRRPVQQPGQLACPLPDHGTGDLAADRRPGHPLRHRAGHIRHAHRYRALSQAAQSGHPRAGHPARG